MRKESSTVQKCKRQMATLGFDSQLAYHRVKLILKIYRDVVWVLSERVEELHEYAWELGAQDADTGLIYLQSFAPDMDLQEFEERVCCVMENRMLVDVIDRALLRLKRYPDRGELYYEILTKQFIHRFNSTEKELLDELNGKVSNHAFGNKLLFTKLPDKDSVLVKWYFSWDGKHPPPCKLGVPLLLNRFGCVP